MVQVLPQVQKRPNPTNEGMNFLFQILGEQQQQQAQAEALQAQGLDPRIMNLPPEDRKIVLANALKGQQGEQGPQGLNALQQSQVDLNKQKLLDLQMQPQKDFAKQIKEQSEKQEKNRQALAPLQGAMDALNRMRELRAKGNLGIGASYSPFAKTREQAGEYEQLGKSLIQYATNIPIRNRLEFETLAEQLYDPNITDATAKGVLNSIERIIRNSMAEFQESGQQQINAPGITKPKIQAGIGEMGRPSISSFDR